MTETVERLKSQVVGLSGPERADLAYVLLESLEPAEEGVDEAWRVEIARRVTEIRDGRAKVRPVDDVLAELRQRHP
jgi:putative addiction module component (TIGR02574 family)